MMVLPSSYSLITARLTLHESGVDTTFDQLTTRLPLYYALLRLQAVNKKNYLILQQVKTFQQLLDKLFTNYALLPKPQMPEDPEEEGAPSPALLDLHATIEQELTNAKALNEQFEEQVRMYEQTAHYLSHAVEENVKQSQSVDDPTLLQDLHDTVDQYQDVITAQKQNFINLRETYEHELVKDMRLLSNLPNSRDVISTTMVEDQGLLNMDRQLGLGG